MFLSRASILLAEKEQRERRKITQQEVADATRLTRATISAWMGHGGMARLDATAARALCNYFGVTLDRLVVFEDDLEGGGTGDGLRAGRGDGAGRTA